MGAFTSRASAFRAYAVRLGLLLGLLTGAAAIASAADDDEDKPSRSKSELPKAPDFKGFMWVTKLTTEVVKADDTTVTFRVYWAHAVKSSSGRGGRGRGRGRRPGLGSGRGHHSPYAIRRPRVKIKWEHHDYTVPYHQDALVRFKQLPPKINPDGKRGFYSAREQDELSAPIGAPGFVANKTDIGTGTIIEAYIIRDRSIPPAKVTDADMRIKYAVVIRQDPNPPKDLLSAASKGSAKPKKKKK